MPFLQSAARARSFRDDRVVEVLIFLDFNGGTSHVRRLCFECIEHIGHKILGLRVSGRWWRERHGLPGLFRVHLIILIFWSV